MNENNIDASIGLTFSLGIFKRYRRNGMLQAELPRAPGIRGRCTAFIRLVEGEVSSVHLEDKQGGRYSTDKETLCRFDKEKGPFEWIFKPLSTASDQPHFTEIAQSPFPAQRNSVLRVISELVPDRLQGWTPQQVDTLYMVLVAIDGKRTIEEVKLAVPLPSDLIDELLRILFELNIIDIEA